MEDASQRDHKIEIIALLAQFQQHALLIEFIDYSIAEQLQTKHRPPFILTSDASAAKKSSVSVHLCDNWEGIRIISIVAFASKYYCWFHDNDICLGAWGTDNLGNFHVEKHEPGQVSVDSFILIHLMSCKHRSTQRKVKDMNWKLQVQMKLLIKLKGLWRFTSTERVKKARLFGHKNSIVCLHAGIRLVKPISVFI